MWLSEDCVSALFVKSPNFSENHDGSVARHHRLSSPCLSSRTMSRNPVAEKAAVSPPSIPAFVPSIIATAILSLALGYWVGVGNSLLSWGSSSSSRRRRSNKKKTLSDDGASSSSDASSEEEVDSDVGQQTELPNEECKLVFSPLKMGGIDSARF